MVVCVISIVGLIVSKVRKINPQCRNIIGIGKGRVILEIWKLIVY